MKTSNVNQPGERAQAIVRGHTGRGRAGSPGTTIIDPLGNEATANLWQVVGATVTDADDETGILTIGGSSGTGTPPWFNVIDYGATGDGTTDDTAAINLAIAALNSAGCGVLYFPCGTYLVSSGLTALTFDGVVCGDGAAADYSGSVSQINCTSTTAVLFTVNSSNLRFEKIALANTAGGTVTAGAGIKVTAATGYERVSFHDILVRWFYDCIDVQGGTDWSMRDVIVFDAWRYGVRIRNLAQVDAGNWLVDKLSVLNNGVHHTTAGLRIESSGASRVINYECLGAIGYNDYGIDISASGNTSVLHVIGASIESYGTDGIRSVGDWPFQTFTNIEFGQYGNGTGHAFNLSGNTDVVIDNINLRANTGTPTAILVSSMTRLAVGQITNNGFTTLISGTVDQDSTGGVGARVFITGTPSSGQVPVASGATAAAWASLSSGGIAPNTVDYLVGTASAGLTSEIVVGTTPGGELGNTWASPTVDTTHSGSAHTDFIAKAFVDAKGDLIAASANDTPARVPVGSDGKVLTADSAAAAGVSWQTPSTAAALDDLSDVTITSATSGDRLRYNGSAWVNSALLWEPHVAYDGTVVLNGNGDPVMVEVSY